MKSAESAQVYISEQAVSATSETLPLGVRTCVEDQTTSHIVLPGVVKSMCCSSGPELRFSPPMSPHFKEMGNDVCHTFERHYACKTLSKATWEPSESHYLGHQRHVLCFIHGEFCFFRRAEWRSSQLKVSCSSPDALWILSTDAVRVGPRSTAWRAVCVHLHNSASFCTAND